MIVSRLGPVVPALVLLTLLSCATEFAQTAAPNILILIADDMGWHDIGYHDSDIKTPTLDKLAAAGVRLERHYVCPTCSPTRAGLLTGRNPSRFGISGPIDGRSTLSLPLKTPTLARTLKDRGYVTGLFGKWHLGLRPEVGPRQYGFDRTYGYFHGQIDQYTHRYKNGDRSWHRNDEFVDEKGHATDLIADETVRVPLDQAQGAVLLLGRVQRAALSGSGRGQVDRSLQGLHQRSVASSLCGQHHAHG